MRKLPLPLSLVLLAAFTLPAAAAAKEEGKLDPGFGDAGRVITPISADGDDGTNAVATQPDGKIIVAGSTAGLGLVARYTANGQLDTSFSGDGVFTLNLGPATGVAVQPDGRIVVSGSAGNVDPYALRLLPDGSPDPDFGAAGTRRIDLGFASNEILADLAIQPDGKIVLAGGAGDGNARNFAIVRLTTTGILDPEFGSGGRAFVDFNGHSDSAADVEIGPAGRIVVGGIETVAVVDNNFAIAALESDGDPDPTFGGGDGEVTAADARLRAIAVAPDGRIVAVGTTKDVLRWLILAYTAEGVPDPSFNSTGRREIDLRPGSDEARDVMFSADGKLVVTGWAIQGSTLFFAAARLTAAGELDPSFSLDGIEVTDFPGDGALGTAGALQFGTEVIVAGSTAGAILDSDLALARYVGDAVAPDTTIVSGPAEGATSGPEPGFAFMSEDPRARFECSVDFGPFAGCESPVTLSPLAAGPHGFAVRAVDPAGNADPTPASRGFTVALLAAADCAALLEQVARFKQKLRKAKKKLRAARDEGDDDEAERRKKKAKRLKKKLREARAAVAAAGC